MTSLRDYADHLAKRSRVIWVAEAPWALRDRVLRPLGPPHRLAPVNREAIRAAVTDAGAFLAQWTEGWDTQPCDWWYVCCDQKEYGIERLRKMVRYDVRRGLDQCEIRKVEGEWFAENGFGVYAAAFQRYGSRPVLTEGDFIKEFRGHATYPGRETWGAFVSGKLVAWESCLVVDDIAVLASAKSDPSYFKARPNNALLYVLTRHYLRERQLSYVMAGSRVLLHDTNVQEFDEKMGYRKVYCPLRIELSPAASLLNALRLPLWADRLGIGKRMRGPLGKLEALGRTVETARSCLNVAVPTDQGVTGRMS